MPELIDKRVLIPLAAIFVIQSVLTMASYMIPVVVPDAAADIGLSPDTVAALVSVVYFVAMGSGLVSGTLVGRFAPARIFQILLVLSALGIFAFTTAHPVAVVVGAILIGLSTGPMNPTGSHVLAAVAPPRWQPFVFSLKQCGTPAGGMLAGAIIPPLILVFGWQQALLVIPAAGLVMFFFASAVLRAPAPAVPQASASAPPRPAVRRGGGARGLGRAIGGALVLVATDPALRRLALGGLMYAACQVGFATYLVVYLWRDVALSPAAAGLTFSFLHLSGIGARIALGLVAGRYIRSDRLLVVLGVVMASGIAISTCFTPAWPLAAIYAVIMLVGMSGNGWVGLFFAEAARLAPAGRTADAASGGQFVMYFGIVGGPLMARETIAATGSYPVALALLAALALLSAAVLAVPGPHRAPPQTRG